MFASIATGLAKLTCCQPEAVSPLKVASASWVPSAVHRCPMWVPVFPDVLVEAQAGDEAGLVGAELDADLDRARVVFLGRGEGVVPDRAGTGPRRPTPGDAYTLLRQAIACPDPVIFLEPKRRYWSKEKIRLSTAGPDIDQALIRRPGTDVTLIAYGGTVATALETADAAAGLGWDVEVVDLRSLAPFDDATVSASVRRTGRAIVVHEASGFGGYGAEVAARLTEQCFHHLQAPILRVTGFDIPMLHRNSKNTIFPTWTGSWTPSSACSGTTPWSCPGAWPDARFPAARPG